MRETFSTSFSIIMMRQIIMICKICSINETNNPDGMLGCEKKWSNYSFVFKIDHFLK